MKKYAKIAVVISIIALISVVSSCSVFSALGKIFVDVQSGGATTPSSFTVKAYLYEVNEDGDTVKEIESQKAVDIEPNSSHSIAFENEIRVGTRVKVFLGLKSKATSSAPSRYFYAEKTFVVVEGANELGNDDLVFHEETNADNIWWY